MTKKKITYKPVRSEQFEEMVNELINNGLDNADVTFSVRDEEVRIWMMQSSWSLVLTKNGTWKLD